MASAEYTRDTFRQAESPVKKMADNPPPVTRKQLEKSKDLGRRLEYPVNRPEQRIQKTLGESPEKRTFSSPHFANKSVKSMRIKAEREEYEAKFQKALDYIIDSNPDVIKERQRLCCQKAKPFGTTWRIPQAGVLSTYKDHYPPKWAEFAQDWEPQNKKQAFGLPDGGNVPKDSTYRDHYQGKYGDPANLADWPEGFKLQGPLGDTTTYQVLTSPLLRTTTQTTATTTKWSPSPSGTKLPQACLGLATATTVFHTRIQMVLQLQA